MWHLKDIFSLEASDVSGPHSRSARSGGHWQRLKIEICSVVLNSSAIVDYKEGAQGTVVAAPWVNLVKKSLTPGTLVLARNSSQG